MASPPSISCADLRTWYEAEQLSVATIAQRVGCSPATISNRLRRCAIPTRSGRFQTIAIDPQELRRLYLDEALPLAVIATTFHVSVGTINNRLRAFGIPTRSASTRRPE